MGVKDSVKMNKVMGGGGSGYGGKEKMQSGSQTRRISLAYIGCLCRMEFEKRIEGVEY